MSNPELPFRTALDNYASETLDGEALEDFLLLANDRHSNIPQAVAERVVKDGPEIACWLLAGKLAWVRGATGRARAAVEARLLGRALDAAAAAGVHWSRVLDRLAGARGWDSAASELEKALGTPVPSADQQAERLASWVATRESPGELDTLLAPFSSAAIHRVVAKHARALTPAQMRILQEDVADLLAENAHLSGAATDHLVRSLVEDFLRAVDANADRRMSGGRRGVGSSTETHGILRKLKTFAESEESFGPELQRFILGEVKQRAKHQRTSAQELARVLLTNPACEREVLDELVGYANPSIRAEILGHPKADAKLRESIMATREDFEVLASAALRVDEEHGHFLTEQHLWSCTEALLYRATDRGVRLSLGRIVKHPNSTPEMWERIAFPWDARNAEMMEALANAPGARHHPEIREQLLRSKRTEVMAGLLEDASAAEFPALLSSLWSKDAKAASKVLKHARIPSGARIPKSLATRMLQSQDSEIRLIAMTALGAAQGEGRERQATPSGRAPSR